MQPAVAVFSWCKVNNHFPITASRRRLFPAGAARRRHSPGGPAAVGAPAACARPALRPWGGGRFGLPYGPFCPAERAVSARHMARFAIRCLSGPCTACPRSLPVAGRAPCRPRPFSHVVLMNARKLPGGYIELAGVGIHCGSPNLADNSFWGCCLLPTRARALSDNSCLFRPTLLHLAL